MRLVRVRSSISSAKTGAATMSAISGSTGVEDQTLDEALSHFAIPIGVDQFADDCDDERDCGEYEQYGDTADRYRLPDCEDEDCFCDGSHQPSTRYEKTLSSESSIGWIRVSRMSLRLREDR